MRSVPNSATYVEDFSAVDVLEMYSMRLLLEPLAARLAARQDRFALVRKLRALCDQMTACTKRGDWAGLDEADYAFHHAVVEASKHSRLMRAYETSHIQVTGIRRSYTILKDLPPQTTAAGHHLIVQYIKEGDADRAERASYDHVNQAMSCLEQHLHIWVEKAGRPVFRSKQDIGTSRAHRNTGRGESWFVRKLYLDRKTPSIGGPSRRWPTSFFAIAWASMAKTAW